MMKPQIVLRETLKKQIIRNYLSQSEEYIIISILQQNLMAQHPNSQFLTTPSITKQNSNTIESMLGESLNKDLLQDVNKPPIFENKLVQRSLSILKPLSEIKNEASKKSAFPVKEEDTTKPQKDDVESSVSKKAPPKRAGDWKCSECNNSNFAWRISCNRCTSPKPPSEILRIHVSLIGPPGFYRDGDWQCFSCRNVNFKRRDNCKRCGAKKPDEYKDLSNKIGASSTDRKSDEKRFEKMSMRSTEGKKRVKSRSRSAERKIFNQ